MKRIAVLCENSDELSIVLKYNDKKGFVSGSGGSLNVSYITTFPVIVPIEQSYWLKTDLLKCASIYTLISVNELEKSNTAAPFKTLEECEERVIEGAKLMRKQLTGE